MVSRTHLTVKFICALPVLSFMHMLQMLVACHSCRTTIFFPSAVCFWRKSILSAGYCTTMTCEIFTTLIFFWRWMGRRGQAEYPPRFPDLTFLDSVNCTSELKNQEHRRIRHTNNFLYRHFTIYNTRSTPLISTSLSTLRWSRWWTFETLRKATQQQIVWPIYLRCSLEMYIRFIYRKPTNVLC
jgi:hypothetical protein